MKLTEHFNLEEFTFSQTALKMGIDNTPSRAVVQWLKYGCKNVLEPLRQELKTPVIVTSGFRCKALNIAVGGVPMSQHVIGQAADLRADKTMQKRIVEILKKNKFVDQVISECKGSVTWIHVSWSVDPRGMFL